MAERRMFAKTIVLSDAFLDMPLGARCLYMTMGMLADDDGFVNAPKSIMRQCGCSEDDLKMLIAKKFVIPFDSGILVIKHWRINNYLQRDRLTPTKYQEELSTLTIESNGAYVDSCIHDSYTPCIHSIDKSSIDKSSIEKNSIECMGADKPPRKRFEPPSVEEVDAYIKEQNYHVDAQRFVDYYTSNGWMVGKNHMKDWKAAVRTWERKDGEDGKPVSCYAPKSSGKFDFLPDL